MFRASVSTRSKASFPTRFRMIVLALESMAIRRTVNAIFPTLDLT